MACIMNNIGKDRLTRLEILIYRSVKIFLKEDIRPPLYRCDGDSAIFFQDTTVTVFTRTHFRSEDTSKTISRTQRSLSICSGKTGKEHLQREREREREKERDWQKNFPRSV